MSQLASGPHRAATRRPGRRRSHAILLSLLIALPILAVPTSSAAAACTKTVTSATALQNAINGASPGAVICLGADISTTSPISISSKSRVTVDGRTYRLKASGYHAGLSVRCSSDITVRDLRIFGSHPQPGTYIPDRQHAHGVTIGGGTRLHFERVTVGNMQGDGFYVAQCGTRWADGVTIHESKVANNGRHGLTVVAGRNVTAKWMRYHNIAFSILDVEPDWNTRYRQGAADLLFASAVSTGWVGRFTSGLVDAPAFSIGTPYRGSGYAPSVGRIRIQDHRIEGGITGIRTSISASGGYRIMDVVIQRNVGWKKMAGVGAGLGMVNARDVDRLSVVSNSNPVNAGVYAVAAKASTSVVASGNTGSGLAGQIKH
jgi:hypothetical protein